MRVTILIDKFPRTPVSDGPGDAEHGEDDALRDSITRWDPRGQMLPWLDEEPEESIEPYPITH